MNIWFDPTDNTIHYIIKVLADCCVANKGYRKIIISLICLSRHTVVCSAAKKAGIPHCEYILQEETKRNFHAYVHSSVLPL